LVATNQPQGPKAAQEWKLEGGLDWGVSQGKNTKCLSNTTQARRYLDKKPGKRGGEREMAGTRKPSVANVQLQVYYKSGERGELS